MVECGKIHTISENTNHKYIIDYCIYEDNQKSTMYINIEKLTSSKVAYRNKENDNRSAKL